MDLQTVSMLIYEQCTLENLIVVMVSFLNFAILFLFSFNNRPLIAG